ncbi:plant UBX domain-containing protein 7-like [Rutidosis leptorrhynchoides]|uniref:plant UBX domain-containing protein 7-like n=1 Tax=Rutidosis leptorrhynchoides TaxID=125765 RepID=UPI003A99C68C
MEMHQPDPVTKWSPSSHQIGLEDQQTMVSLFLEVAVGQTADTDKQFLQATSWKLEDAIQLFYAGNEFGSVTAPSHVPPLESKAFTSAQSSGWGNNDMAVENIVGNSDNEVRAPLTVKRDVLYDSLVLYGYVTLLEHQDWECINMNSMHQFPFANSDEEMTQQPGVWEAEKGSTSATEASGDNHNLASLYRPPVELLFNDERLEDDDEMRLTRELSMGTMNDSHEDSLKDSGVVEKVSKKEECFYPPLPEEPEGDANLLCRVGIRLSDGRRLQRNFLRTDPFKV